MQLRITSLSRFVIAIRMPVSLWNLPKCCMLELTAISFLLFASKSQRRKRAGSQIQSTVQMQYHTVYSGKMCHCKRRTRVTVRDEPKRAKISRRLKVESHSRTHPRIFSLALFSPSHCLSFVRSLISLSILRRLLFPTLPVISHLRIQRNDNNYIIYSVLSLFRLGCSFAVEILNLVSD